ncbi:MarC family protein [Acidisoma sp. C75]
MLANLLPGPVSSALDTFLLAFSALFAIVNPILNTLIFAGITADRSHAERLRLARRVGLYSFLLLLLSIWAISYVLNFFGVTLGALQVAGGLTIAVGAWRILHAPERQEAVKESQALHDGRTISASSVNDIAFFPMSIPFSIGPGTISVCISLSADRPAQRAWLYLLTLTAAGLAMALVIWGLFSFADRIRAFIGRTGARALTRLFALLLLCIGVQIIAAGAETLLTPIIAAAHG